MANPNPNQINDPTSDPNTDNMHIVYIETRGPEPPKNKLKDRFATEWDGPNDQDAIDWVTINPGKKIQYYFPNGNVNKSALEKANKEWNKMFRKRHSNDREIDTGKTLCGGKGADGRVNLLSSWHYATRGEKLRTVKIYHKLYTEKLREAEKRKASFADGDLRMDKAKIDVAALKEMLRLLDELEAKILEETKPGWDHRNGLPEQRDIRSKQFVLCRKISPEFQIDKDMKPFFEELRGQK